MKKTLLVSLTLIAICFFIFGTAALAQNPPVNPPGNPPVNNAGGVALENPLSSSDPAVIIGNIIKGILGLTGVIALVAFVAGGLMWMTSGGNPEKVKKGRDILVWATLGLFIIFSSYSILKYVFQIFT